MMDAGGGERKYTTFEERRASRVCKELKARVRRHRAMKLKQGKLPSLSYKAKCGAIMSLFLAKTNGKYAAERI